MGHPIFAASTGSSGRFEGVEGMVDGTVWWGQGPDRLDDNPECGQLSWRGEVGLATASYESALQIAASLSREEQLRLIRELTVRAAQEAASEEETSLLTLCGLGQEIWQQMDAQEYVRRERSSWNG